eukprot:g61021.t1
MARAARPERRHLSRYLTPRRHLALQLRDGLGVSFTFTLVSAPAKFLSGDVGGSESSSADLLSSSFSWHLSVSVNGTESIIIGDSSLVSPVTLSVDLLTTSAWNVS